MKLKYKYFAIDFDGTIAYDAYPGVGELIPGAKETMMKIKELGGEIVIWTCRTDQWAEDAKKFLDDNNVPYDKFNESFDHHVNIYGGDNGRKIYADCYIDDRSLHFGCKPVDWKVVRDLIFTTEEWQNGDTIECIKDMPGNFKIGERFTLLIRPDKYLKDGYYVIGPMGTDKESAQEYFKKVN